MPATVPTLVAREVLLLLLIDGARIAAAVSSCSTRSGEQLCCPVGMRTYGDGSACKAIGKPSCALWGNAGLDICVDDALVLLKKCFGPSRRSEVLMDCKCLVIEVTRTSNVPAGSLYGAATVGTVRIYASEGDAVSAEDYIWEGRTLELPYRNNQAYTSSIPATSFTPYSDYDSTTTFAGGQFIVDGDLETPKNAEIFYKGVRLGNSKSGLDAGQGLYMVDDSWSGGNRELLQRSDLKFHVGNQAKDTSGCILIGKDVIIDSKGARLKGGIQEGSTATTRDFYDVIDQYVNSGYETIRVKMTQATGASDHFTASEVSESALSELEEETRIREDGSFEFPIETSVKVTVSGSCETSQPLKEVLNDCWESILGSLLIVVKISISFSSCISADTLIQTRERGIIKAGMVQKGEMIGGRNETGSDVWCTVISQAWHGTGYVSGNFTPDHFMVEIGKDGKKRIMTNGNTHPRRLASLVNIATDCDMAQTADGQLFTPFSTSFCPDLSWTNYLDVLWAIRTLTRKEELSFLWDPNVWHDNASHAFFPAIRRLCSSIVTCIHNKECAPFQNTVDQILDSNLEPTKKELVTSSWPSSSDMASAIKNMTIYAGHTVSFSPDSPVSSYSVMIITTLSCTIVLFRTTV